MRAIHKYKHSAEQGNKEAQRRIAQSMGYRISIWDMPHMVELLKRSDIDISKSTDNTIMADTKTISL